MFRTDTLAFSEESKNPSDSGKTVTFNLLHKQILMIAHQLDDAIFLFANGGNQSTNRLEVSRSQPLDQKAQIISKKDGVGGKP